MSYIFICNTIYKMKRALLIGINYTSVPESRLQGCINDVVNMGNILATKYGYEKSNITTLRDDSSAPDVKPTRANILNNLAQIINDSGNCSEIWIHYSGHGTQVADKNGDEAERMDEAIVPMDYKTAGFIIDDLLLAAIRNIKCRAFLLFDSCHSGTVCDLEWSYEYIAGANAIRTKNNNAYIQNPNIFMFSGCKDSQTSADIYERAFSQYQGAFTDMFLRALSNNNYNVRMEKLYKDVCNLLRQNGYSQKSIFSSSSAAPNFALTSITAQKAIAAPLVSVMPTTGNSSAKKAIMRNMQMLMGV
jgi:hypothetical protein